MVVNAETTRTQAEMDGLKLNLFEKLLKLIEALRGKNCYEMMEKIQEGLNNISDNSEATAQVLENLIKTTSDLAGRLDEISEENVESTIKDIEKQIDEISRRKDSLNEYGYESKNNLFEKSVSEYSSLIDFENAELYKSEANNYMYVRDVKSDTYYCIVDNQVNDVTFFQFQPHDTAVESISQLKLTPVALSDSTLDNTTQIRKHVLEKYFPNYESASELDNATKQKLEALQNQRAASQNKLDKLKTLRDGISSNGFKAVLRDDNVYCVEHQNKNAMIEFRKTQGKIVAHLYTNYDKNTLEGTGKGIAVGLWQNDEKGGIQSSLNFDREYIVRDIIRSEAATGFLELNGISSGAVKSMLKEDGIKGFKTANSEHLETIVAIENEMRNHLPEGYHSTVTNDKNGTYICVTSPTDNKTYINFNERGEVHQYAFKYNTENDLKCVSERGLTTIREERANHEDYKNSVKAFEDSTKHINKETEKKIDADKKKDQNIRD